jgi:F0F1-type ATP synthase assembly protein I
MESGRGWAYFALFSEIGLVLLVTTLVGVGLGYWIDTRLGTVPLFVLIGVFAGMAVGARSVWLTVSRFLARMDEQDARPPGRG